jgi:hypothetical protein
MNGDVLEEKKSFIAPADLWVISNVLKSAREHLDLLRRKFKCAGANSSDTNTANFTRRLGSHEGRVIQQGIIEVEVCIFPKVHWGCGWVVKGVVGGKEIVDNVRPHRPITYARRLAQATPVTSGKLSSMRLQKGVCNYRF